MPICNKPPMEAAGSKGAASEIDNHTSEAAKMKRQREQAYFNSYNFDAIEVLPYEDGNSESPAKVVNLEKSERRHKPPTQLAKGKLRTYAAVTTTATHRPLSPNSRRHLKHSLLMAQSSSSHSSISSHSSGSSYSLARQHTGIKYAYLQRLGAFFTDQTSGQFKQTASTSNSIGSSRSSSNEMPRNEIILDMRSGMNEISHGMPMESSNGGFLLPRAMLKYQSVGSLNSMPLAVIATTHSSCNSSNISLQNSMNNNYSSYSSSNNNNKNSNISSSSNNNNSKNIGNIALQMANNSHLSKNVPTLRSTEKTRLSRTYGDGDNTGFLIIADKSSSSVPNKSSAVAAATTTTTTTRDSTALTRNKKQLTSSTIPTITTASGSSNAALRPSAISGDTSNRPNMQLTKSKAPTISSSSASSSTAIGGTGATPEQRDHTNSHQSHYSTEKSGSSGYYSSNVCSTYSLEDHIYCEPVVDILDLNSKSVVANGKVEKLALTHGKKVSATVKKVEQNSQVRDMNAIVGPGQRYKGCDASKHDGDNDNVDAAVDGIGNATASGATDRQCTMQSILQRPANLHHPPSQHFSENLRILETSIENLDRHLRNFPNLTSQERIASFVQTHHSYLQHHVDPGEKVRMHSHLPTIMEGYDPATQPRPFQDDIADDSLLDIDLDSFLLVNERKVSKRNKCGKPSLNPKVSGGVDNPTFIADEQEENNYKCAKYINSCPEDAYYVESDIVAGTRTVSGSEKSLSVENFVKRYEDQLHFQNTRELLEDVRDKIRLLADSNSESHSNSGGSRAGSHTLDDEMPKELEGMIKTLKSELESYLSRMNQQSELEIRQLCSGLVKNQKIVKMKKAFERRRSISSLNGIDEEYEISPYEVIRHKTAAPVIGGVPNSIRAKINSIRCASDPNFKMKRKSINEVFPMSECYIESISGDPHLTTLTPNNNNNNNNNPMVVQRSHSTQLQRNLAFHKPILNQADTKINTNATSSGELSRGSSATESGESGDKDSMLEWHRKKPSIWEMYYGTNRMNQTLLGKRNGGMLVASSQVTMSYPSSRPESDFTLDLPRAEQLRIKMEKEKRFRQRCRFITTFLSLVFFLCTVMVVSLVLTRGKRMFGSMI